MFKTGMIILIIYTIIYNIVIAATGDDYYGTASTYNDICFKRNLFAWLPLIALALIFLGSIYVSNFDTIMNCLLLTVFAGFASIINSLHASHHNITTGINMDVSPDNERFKKEVNNEDYGKAAAIGSALYLSHKLKDGINDIADVDNWKEFK